MSSQVSDKFRADMMEGVLEKVAEGLREILSRDFAVTEDISTLPELDMRQAYDRGVMDVQDAVAAVLSVTRPPVRPFNESRGEQA